MVILHTVERYYETDFFPDFPKQATVVFFPYQHKHVRMNNERFLNIENNFNDNPKGFNE